MLISFAPGLVLSFGTAVQLVAVRVDYAPEIPGTSSPRMTSAFWICGPPPGPSLSPAPTNLRPHRQPAAPSAAEKSGSGAAGHLAAADAPSNDGPDFRRPPAGEPSRLPSLNHLAAGAVEIEFGDAQHSHPWQWHFPAGHRRATSTTGDIGKVMEIL